MKDEHLSVEHLARLMAAEMNHEELMERVLPHLLEHCPICRERYEEVRRLQKESEHWDETVAVVEGLEAPEQLRRLSALPFDEQLSLVTDDESFQTWGLCQLLLKESVEAGFEDAARAINLAELAVKISQDLGESYHPHWVLDLRARAHAHLANARRVLGELRSAEAAMREAESLLARSLTGNPVVEAEILHLKASLLCSQRRHGEALELIERSLAIYREQRLPEKTGPAILKKAKILEDAGDLDEALRVLRGALAEIPGEARRLAVYTRYNLVLCLTLAGQYEEAGQLLEEIRDTFREEARPLDHLRLRWTEGKIAGGLGRSADAEAIYREVQEAFLARGMGYDAALAALDLAVLYAQAGRTQDLKRLATVILQIFQTHGVQREAAISLMLFQNACEEERLTVQMIHAIATMLRQERRD